MNTKKGREMATIKGNCPPHGRQRYPWSKWLNGKWHRVRGNDWGVEIETLRRQISDKARVGGMRAITRVRGDVVQFCVTERT